MVLVFIRNWQFWAVSSPSSCGILGGSRPQSHFAAYRRRRRRRRRTVRHVRGRRGRHVFDSKTSVCSQNASGCTFLVPWLALQWVAKWKPMEVRDKGLPLPPPPHFMRRGCTIDVLCFRHNYSNDSSKITLAMFSLEIRKIRRRMCLWQTQQCISIRLRHCLVGPEKHQQQQRRTAAAVTVRK